MEGLDDDFLGKTLSYTETHKEQDSHALTIDGLKTEEEDGVTKYILTMK